MNLIDPILAELAHEGATTRRLLDRLPQDRLGWQPHQKSMTLGRLATHIAEIPGWVGSIATHGLDVADFQQTATGVGDDQVEVVEFGSVILAVCGSC